MRRSLLVLIISGISTGAVASGYALWTYSMGDRGERPAATARAPADHASQPAPASAAVRAPTPPPSATPPGASALLAIEVARIDAGGPSVLAGRSPPNHRVTVLANGREIASVIATDEGQWSAIVSEGIAAGPLELSIVSQAKEGGALVRGAARQLVVPPAAASSLTVATPQSAHPQPTKVASVGNKAPAPHTTPQPIERPQAEAKRPVTSPSLQAPAEGEDAASKRALAEFEALVERTRREVAAQKTDRVAPLAESGRSAAATSLPPTALAPATAQSPTASMRAVEGPAAPVMAQPETKLAAAIPAAVSPPLLPSPRPDPAPAAVQAPIPVPITFLTNRATLTPNGERAAELLAEYLRLKRPAGITLTGHADARGPDGYNMRLSLRRLEAIERYLRAAGYAGELSLIPRGKREPYLGIDRRRLPLREIYQADRRVELRLTP